MAKVFICRNWFPEELQRVVQVHETEIWMEECNPPRDQIIGPSLHKHEELYCLLGDIELEVTLGDEKHRAKAPASILVPAGIDHAIRFVGGKGYLVNVLSGAKYR